MEWLAGFAISESATLLDVAATILGAARLVPDQMMGGQDLLSPPTNIGDRTLHWCIDLPTFHDNWCARTKRAVRQGSRKYLWDSGFDLLYDLEKDPGEREYHYCRQLYLAVELIALAENDW